MRQQYNRRRGEHRLIRIAGRRVMSGRARAETTGLAVRVLEAAAAVPAAERPAERRAPAAVGEDEAEHGEHDEEGGYALALLGHRVGAGRPTGKAHPEPVAGRARRAAAAAAHRACFT